MGTSSTRALAGPLALAGLAGLAAGWGLGAWGAGTRGAPPAAAGSPGTPEPARGAALEPVLADLARAVGELRDALASVPATGRQREPAVGPSRDVGVEPLVLVLEQGLADVAAAVRGAHALGGADASGASDLRLPRPEFEPAPFPPREAFSTREFSRAHVFLAAQQIVDAYGVPDRVSATRNGEHVWAYDQGDDGDLEFVLHDGFVLRVEW